MVAQLHAMGFEVTCWVMPFVEERSHAYKWVANWHAHVLHSRGDVMH
jgi:hypothetical protein